MRQTGFFRSQNKIPTLIGWRTTSRLAVAATDITTHLLQVGMSLEFIQEMRGRREEGDNRYLRPHRQEGASRKLPRPHTAADGIGHRGAIAPKHFSWVVTVSITQVGDENETETHFGVTDYGSASNARYCGQGRRSHLGSVVWGNARSPSECCCVSRQGWRS